MALPSLNTVLTSIGLEGRRDDNCVVDGSLRGGALHSSQNGVSLNEYWQSTHQQGMYCAQSLTAGPYTTARAHLSRPYDCSHCSLSEVRWSRDPDGSCPPQGPWTVHPERRTASHDDMVLERGPGPQQLRRWAPEQSMPWHQQIHVQSSHTYAEQVGTPAPSATVLGPQHLKAKRCRGDESPPAAESPEPYMHRTPPSPQHGAMSESEASTATQDEQDFHDNYKAARMLGFDSLAEKRAEEKRLASVDKASRLLGVDASQLQADGGYNPGGYSPTKKPKGKKGRLSHQGISTLIQALEIDGAKTGMKNPLSSARAGSCETPRTEISSSSTYSNFRNSISNVLSGGRFANYSSHPAGKGEGGPPFRTPPESVCVTTAEECWEEQPHDTPRSQGSSAFSDLAAMIPVVHQGFITPTGAPAGTQSPLAPRPVLAMDSRARKPQALSRQQLVTPSPVPGGLDEGFKPPLHGVLLSRKQQEVATRPRDRGRFVKRQPAFLPITSFKPEVTPPPSWGTARSPSILFISPAVSETSESMDVTEV